MIARTIASTIIGELLSRLAWVGIATAYSEHVTEMSMWQFDMKFFASHAFDGVVPFAIAHFHETKLSFVLISYLFGFGTVAAVTYRKEIAKRLAGTEHNEEN